MEKHFKKAKKRSTIIGITAFALINLAIILITVLVKTAKPDAGIEAWSGSAVGAAFKFLLNVVYLNNFFKQPALLLGSLTLAGYLLIGRGWRESIIGMLKTIIGYLLLTIGSGTLVSIAKPVFKNIQELGSGVVPLDPYFSLSSATNFFDFAFGEANKYSSLISFALLVGFVVNIISVALKRFTNTSSLMITGHVMLQQSAVVTTIFYILLFRQIPLLSDGSISAGGQAGLIIISGIFLGTYWATASTATLKPTNAVTQNAGFAIGHQQMLAIATTYKLGKYFGKKEDSAENKKLPSYLKIFEDNIFTQTLIIFVLFAILFIVLIASKGGVDKFINKDLVKFNDVNGLGVWNSTFGGANFVLNIIGGSLKLVASLIAIMTGVRMFITELQQSFHGISEKLIPGTVVAVDVAAVYGFSINSVTFGFVSGVIGQFLGVAIMIGLSRAIPGHVFVTIPLFITLFFNSGSLGVYANASGGWKAAAILPGLIGLFEIIIISFATKALSNAAVASNIKSPVDGGYIGMADWTLFFGALMWFSSYNVIVAWIFVTLAILGMFFMAQVVDSGTQTKKTLVQKLFKLNPTLITK